MDLLSFQEIWKPFTKQKWKNYSIWIQWDNWRNRIFILEWKSRIRLFLILKFTIKKKVNSKGILKVLRLKEWKLTILMKLKSWPNLEMQNLDQLIKKDIWVLPYKENGKNQASISNSLKTKKYPLKIMLEQWDIIIMSTYINDIIMTTYIIFLFFCQFYNKIIFLF